MLPRSCFLNKSANVVYIWVDKSAHFVANTLFQILSSEERMRYKEFRNTTHRHDYVVAHALKRVRIARILGVDNPSELRFGRHTSGKPYLLDKMLYFNLSHSHGRVALAISHTCECAIDIETHRPLTALDLLIEKTMSRREKADIERAQSPLQAFFHRWVIKEAFVKVSGIGLRIPFNKLCTIREPKISDFGVGIFNGTTVYSNSCSDFSLAAGGIGNINFILEQQFTTHGSIIRDS